MILTCPNCASRFLLSAQVLAPEGRRVKCSSCGEEWFQLPDPDELIDNIENEIEEIPESVKPIPEGSSVPALADDEDETSGSGRANLMGYAAALVVFIGILGGLIMSKDAMLKTWLPSAAFYEMIGMDVTAPGEGLVFDKIKATQRARNVVVVEGFIINLSDEAQPLPAIEVSIRNEAGEVIQQNVSPAPYDEMPPESSLPFKSTHSGKPDEADHVQMRFVYDKAKNVSKDDDNTQALHEGDHAEPHGDAAH